MNYDSWLEQPYQPSPKRPVLEPSEVDDIVEDEYLQNIVDDIYYGNAEVARWFIDIIGGEDELKKLIRSKTNVQETEDYESFKKEWFLDNQPKFINFES